MKKLPEIGQQVKVRKAALTLFPEVKLQNEPYIGLIGTVVDVYEEEKFSVAVKFPKFNGLPQWFHPSELAKSK